MDRVWISSLIGALTGGMIATSCILILTAPLWTVLVLYPLIGSLTALIIFAVWHRVDPPYPASASLPIGLEITDFAAE